MSVLHSKFVFFCKDFSLMGYCSKTHLEYYLIYYFQLFSWLLKYTLSLFARSYYILLNIILCSFVYLLFFVCVWELLSVINFSHACLFCNPWQTKKKKKKKKERKKERKSKKRNRLLEWVTMQCLVLKMLCRLYIWIVVFDFIQHFRCNLYYNRNALYIFSPLSHCHD